MRTWIITLCTILALFTCTSIGCKHEANTYVKPEGPSSGDWTVSYFNDNGVDMKEHLGGYHFDFKADGSLVVWTGMHTTYGNWQISNDNNHLEFLITYNEAIGMLAETAEDWDVATKIATELDLVHSHPGHSMEIHLSKQ